MRSNVLQSANKYKSDLYFFRPAKNKNLSEGNLPWAPTGETGGETGRSDHRAVLFTR